MEPSNADDDDRVHYVRGKAQLYDTFLPTHSNEIDWKPCDLHRNPDHIKYYP